MFVQVEFVLVGVGLTLWSNRNESFVVSELVLPTWNPAVVVPASFVSKLFLEFCSSGASVLSVKTFWFVVWAVVPWGVKIATWLILPVVIRSSQRLSHACLSINVLLWNCERLIISVIVYLIVPYYLDNRSNSRANTCVNTLLGSIY